MSGGKTEARDKGGNEVVRTRGFGFGGDAYSVTGGGANRGGIGEGRGGDCNRILVKWGGVM